MIYWPTKTPSRSINYGMNWAPTLARLGDRTIVTSIWLRVSGDVTLGASSIASDGKSSSTRVSAGTAGVDSVVKNVVTLDDGQILDETAFIRVRL